MRAYRLIRDYENPDLPLERRLPSLARRFTCLEDAQGLDPWSPERFHSWIESMGNNSPAWHAGHLILNVSGGGPWRKFDAIAAIGAWNEKDRATFAAWARTWM